LGGFGERRKVKKIENSNKISELFFFILIKEFYSKDFYEKSYQKIVGAIFLLLRISIISSRFLIN